MPLSMVCHPHGVVMSRRVDLMRGCQTVLPRELSVQRCYPARITLTECQRACDPGMVAPGSQPA